MKKDFEEKILQELIDKVIQRDRDLKNRHEKEAVENATKEALSEMTELSSEEIDQIEKELRIKYQIRDKKRKYSLILIISVLLIISFIIFKFVDREHFKNQLVFSEEFNDNSNGWEHINDIIYNKYYKDGSFFFITNSDEKCYTEKLEMDFPATFTAEITTTWHGGNKAPYGVVFSTYSNTSHDAFYLHPDHKAYTDFEYKSSDPWIQFPVSTDNGENTNIQKFVAKRGYDFDYMPTGLIKYFVNDHHIEDAKTNYPLDAKLSLKLCGSQSVSFDHIKITDDRTGKIVVNSSFGELKHKLEERFEFRALGTIEKGYYDFNTDIKGKCYSSEIPYQLNKYSKLRLKSKWIDGEEYYYGFILKSDDQNYYAFEIKSNGKACFIKRVNGNDEIFADDIDTGFPSKGDVSIEQTVILEDRKILYFVNDQLIYENESDRLEINSLGLRVCGRQYVKFDELEIWE